MAQILMIAPASLSLADNRQWYMTEQPCVRTRK